MIDQYLSLALVMRDAIITGTLVPRMVGIFLILAQRTASGFFDTFKYIFHTVWYLLFLISTFTH